MARHLDELELIAAASGLRSPDDRLYRHWARCPLCQRRAQEILAAWDGWVPATGSRIPPCPTPLPRRPRQRWTVAMAAAAVALLLLAWPKLGWGGPAPWGPTGASVLAFGRTTRLQPVSAPSGSVSLRWGPSGWAFLNAADLPSLPTDRVYEVWWIAGSQHVEASTFRPSPSGQARLWLYSARHFQGVTAVGITAEPAPGRPSPTGPREFYAALRP